MNDKIDVEATVVNQRVTPKFYIKGVSQQVADKVYPLSNNTKFGSTTLGRESDCHIVVNEPGVSRQHAAFHVEEGAVWLEDLNSANGTFVNKVSISRQEIYPGDLIAFDKVQFKLEVLGDVVRPAQTPGSRPARMPPVQPAAQVRQTAEPPAAKRRWVGIVLMLVLVVLAGLTGYILRDVS
ncbi:MAG: FHA domain-containing protein [Gammaproteobacteria bacterium]